MTGTAYRLEVGEPTGIAGISQVLDSARKLAGSPTVRTVAKASGVHPMTVRALLTWHQVAGVDPEWSYQRGLSLQAGCGSAADVRLRAITSRLRRPQLATIERIARGMGCKDPALVAALAASVAPHVIVEPRLSDAS